MDQSGGTAAITNTANTDASRSERNKKNGEKCVKRDINGAICILYLCRRTTCSFTQTRWDINKSRLKQRLSLRGESWWWWRGCYRNFINYCVDIDFAKRPDDAGCHATCYRRFNDKNEWMPPRNAAHRLRERRMILGLCECESVPPDRVDPGASSETPEKKRRSRTGLTAFTSGDIVSR